MHPILKDRARLGAYLLGWVPILAMFASYAAVNRTPWPAAIIVGVTAVTLAATLFLSSYYLCVALPIASTHSGIAVGTWATASLAMGSIWAMLLYSVLRILSGVYPALKSSSTLNLGGFLLLSAIGSILYILVVTLHYLLITMEEQRETERTEQELRVLAREAELKALRAQLNPHFLFNSLNSISALTTLDARRAREMCVLLSDFLRKSLRLGERSTVRLSEELDLVRNYLAIEQIRFGSRLQVEWAVEPSVEDVEIPTLLLQPLVENAIKHGIAQIPEGGVIRIQASARGVIAEIHVENPVDPDAERPQGLGLGLRQVKQRLQGRYGSQTYFEAQIREGRHEVVLTFPKNPSEVEA